MMTGRDVLRPGMMVQGETMTERDILTGFVKRSLNPFGSLPSGGHKNDLHDCLNDDVLAESNRGAQARGRQGAKGT